LWCCKEPSGAHKGRSHKELQATAEPHPANTEQVPHVPGYAPRTLLSIFTPSPSRTLRIISANHLKTGRPWVPPSVAIRNYRSILHTQHKDADPTAFRRMFLPDVAQKARNRPSELKIPEAEATTDDVRAANRTRSRYHRRRPARQSPVKKINAPQTKATPIIYQCEAKRSPAKQQLPTGAAPRPGSVRSSSAGAS
jgi:hypothetical protein